MKRIKDYTLGEVVKICKSRKLCDASCVFHKKVFGVFGVCRLCHMPPSNFNLTDRPRFTAQEVENAKALIRLFDYRDNARIRRYSSGLLEVSGNDNLGEHRSRLEMGAFPSISDGESYTLAEIIAEGKEDKDND